MSKFNFEFDTDNPVVQSLLMLAVGLLFGFLLGAAVLDESWKAANVRNGAMEYRANPKTGVSSIYWLTKPQAKEDTPK